MSTTSNTRNFTEPPPYPGTTTVPRTTTPYSHISHSTINKFSGRNDTNKPSALLVDQRKPYVPLGEIRRNVPNQVNNSGNTNLIQARPAPIKQQVGVPQVQLSNQMMVTNRDQQAGPPSYQATANGPSFNQQVSQASLRPVPLKEDGEGEQQMSEEELMMLTVPVLVRRLIDTQNKMTTQASEIKGSLNALH